MKQLFLLLLLMPLFSRSQVNNTTRSAFDQLNQFSIEGKIKGYRSGSENGFVTIRTYDIRGRALDTSVTINANGEFTSIFLQVFEGNIALMYNNEFIELYSSPSEIIKLEIDEDKWKTEPNKTKAIHIEGRSAAISMQMIDYLFVKKMHHFTDPIQIDEKQDFQNYVTASIDRMQKELELFNNYLQENKITDEKYIQWGKNDIIYKAGTEISFCRFVGVWRDTTMTHERFMDYLKGFVVDNTQALHNSSYFEFLHQLRVGLEIVTNVNPQYRDTIMKNGNSFIPVWLDKIDEYSGGFAKELMYYCLYQYDLDHNAPASSFYISRFNTVIINFYLKKIFTEAKIAATKEFAPYNVIERIKKYPASNSFLQKLQVIMNKHKGQFVYIDFWGSWCGPCMLEMPLYPKLIERFKNKPITFLFLAVATEDKKIQEVKNKNKIAADFISLTGNETNILNNVFQFSSYPSHFLLDPTGKLVDNTIRSIGFENELSTETVDQIERSMTGNK